MPDAQLTNKLSSQEIVRPRCPMCDGHMETLRVVSGRPGFEYKTLRCSKCRLICEAQAPAENERSVREAPASVSDSFP
jgi:tRNA(Ile2) C34 agmatinyltransferase TiaS